MSFHSNTVRPPVMNVDVEYYEVHAENLFTVSKTFRVVPDNNYAYIRIKPTTKSCHVQINWATEGKAYLRTFEGASFPLVNSAYIPWNRVIGSIKTATTEVYTLQTATANLIGSMRGDDAAGASGNPNTQAGGAGSGRLETVILPGYELLIEVQNVAGANKYIDLILNFYEM